MKESERDVCGNGDCCAPPLRAQTIGLRSGESPSQTVGRQHKLVRSLPHHQIFKSRRWSLTSAF
jgi:hypothetical protein